MFRTAVRRFIATSRLAAGTVQELTMAEIETAFKHGIQVSQAQGIAKRGLIDGEASAPSDHFDFLLKFGSNWQNAHD